MCRLRNGGHFVAASMWFYYSDVDDVVGKVASNPNKPMHLLCILLSCEYFIKRELLQWMISHRFNSNLTYYVS